MKRFSGIGFLGTALGAFLLLALTAPSADAQTSWSYATARQSDPSTVRILGLGADHAATVACWANEDGTMEAVITGAALSGGYVYGTSAVVPPTCTGQLNAWEGPACGQGTLLTQSFVAVSSCTPSNPPAAPDGVLLDPVSNSEMKVSWNDNANNEDEYLVNFCNVTLNGAGCAPINNAGSVGPNTTMFNHIGLTANTDYKYQVCARNTSGTACSVATPTATTLALPPAPTAPSSVVLNVVSNVEIEVNWSDDATDEDEYLVKYCNATLNGACAPTMLAGTLGPNTTMFNHTGLLPETMYKYVVCASNAGGSSCSTDETETTATTPPPGPVSAAAVSSSQINVDWTDPMPSEGFSFHLYMCQGVGCTLQFHSTVPGTGNSNVNTIVDGLDENTTYSFNVKTLWNGYESAFSNTAEATTLIGGQALVQQSGQVLCYDSSDNTIDCSNPAAVGQDGQTLAGVPWPSPRFVDGAPECSDGVSNPGVYFLDKLTNLCYLFDPCSCFGTVDWYTAVSDAADVYTGSGVCNTNDNSNPGDWRAPQFFEAASLVDFQNAGDPINPGLPQELIDLLNSYGKLACWDNSVWTSTTWFAGAPVPHDEAWQPGWESAGPGPLHTAKTGTAQVIVVKDPNP